MGHIWKIIPYFTAVIATAGVIYLTPLKHINVIEPIIDDIDPAAFQADFEKNPDKYIFLDVRPTEMYDRLHATGSKSLPLHLLYNERHTLPKSGKTIVLICSGGLASGVGYSYLEHFGFFNIRRIQGGIENWQINNLPITAQSVF